MRFSYTPLLHSNMAPSSDSGRCALTALATDAPGRALANAATATPASSTWVTTLAAPVTNASHRNSPRPAAVNSSQSRYAVATGHRRRSSLKDPGDLNDARRHRAGAGTPGTIPLTRSRHPQLPRLLGHRYEQWTLKTQRHPASGGDVIGDVIDQVHELGPAAVRLDATLVGVGARPAEAATRN
jgi:hypothetical protein